MTDTTDSMALRIVELEERLAHFEAMADELSSVVAEQGRLIDGLAARLEAAMNRLEEVAARPYEPRDERPPHY